MFTINVFEVCPSMVSSLALGEKDGYIFTMMATPSGFTLNANPKVFNTSGRRTFFSDQTKC
jgi:hypothetical protein